MKTLRWSLLGLAMSFLLLAPGPATFNIAGFEVQGLGSAACASETGQEMLNTALNRSWNRSWNDAQAIVAAAGNTECEGCGSQTKLWFNQNCTGDNYTLIGLSVAVALVAVIKLPKWIKKTIKVAGGPWKWVISAVVAILQALGLVVIAVSLWWGGKCYVLKLGDVI